ncbi:P27 family phage terminase small subunit [Ralstonia pseudosolanacearum]|uniref:P27 family phage terminase small subunit n=1 Tax=Ralstonia pseudosolanacearum TaxID=1310165 RepID=UPI001FF98917|nr:P27 family phage terminase small subunit [Ralstonia pseudosolanacearum]
MGLQNNEAPAKSPETPSGRSVGGGKEIRSPAPPPGTNLTPRERKVWDYICAQLREAGMPHLTAGIAIAVVCRTFIRWVNTELELQNFEASNGGSYFIKTPKGYEQPHQLFYAAAAIKKELLTWLPESCLTLPSTVTARAKLGDEGVQDDLFAELFEHGLERVAPRNRLPA